MFLHPLLHDDQDKKNKTKRKSRKNLGIKVVVKIWKRFLTEKDVQLYIGDSRSEGKR